MREVCLRSAGNDAAAASPVGVRVFFGGVPKKVVLDNAKCAIVRAVLYDPVVQRSYRECAEYLSRVVERRRMKASVYHALLLTKELLGTPIPPDILDRFRPTYLRRKLFECTWQRGLIGHARDSGFGSFEGPIYYVLEMDGFSDKLNFIFRSLFPPQEWISSRFSLPRSKRLYARYLRELTTKSRRAKG